MLKILQKIKHLEHYALWVFMFFFVIDYHFWEDNWLEAIGNTSVELLIYILIFYYNFKIAIPLFLEKGQKIVYGLVILASLILYILTIQFTGLEHYLYESSYWRNVLSMTINFGLFWLISTLLWSYQKLQIERENQLQQKAERLESELRFLKNQISPHFIFNTLNNIYSLVQQGHKNAAPMLAQLSTILRYILYESSREKVLLTKEIKTIQDYIQLQLFRKPKSTNIDFYQEGNLQNLQIAPLILLNFVENCFKHSNIEVSENAWIKISCIVNDQALEFITENSKEKIVKERPVGGLGNQNIRRQLELNYAGNHEFHIENNLDAYKVTLLLKLD